MPVPPPPTDATLAYVSATRRRRRAHALGRAHRLADPAVDADEGSTSQTSAVVPPARSPSTSHEGYIAGCGGDSVAPVRKVIDGLAAGETKSFYVSSSGTDRIVTADYFKQVRRGERVQQHEDAAGHVCHLLTRKPPLDMRRPGSPAGLRCPHHYEVAITLRTSAALTHSAATSRRPSNATRRSRDRNDPQLSELLRRPEGHAQANSASWAKVAPAWA